MILSWFQRIHFVIVLLKEQIFGQLGWPLINNLFRPLFYRNLTISAENLPNGQNLKITELNFNDVQNFRNLYFKTSTPVVFRNAAQDWDCVKKWNLDYLNQVCGSKNVLLAEADGLTSKNKSEQSIEILEFQNLVENIKSGGDKYLRFSPLIDQHPELAKDLNLNWLDLLKGPGTIGNTYYLFIGGKNTVTHLHNDQPCNLFVQIYGQKKWTLFPVRHSPFLYPQATRTAYFKCEPDLSQKEKSQFPLVEKADRYEITLNPGDVLYVPPHVWHFVENLTDTIGLGYRFSSIKAAFNSSPLFTILRLLAFNPPIWKTIQYGKKDTNLIWAHASGQQKEALSQLEKKHEENSQQNKTI